MTSNTFSSACEEREIPGGNALDWELEDYILVSIVQVLYLQQETSP